MTCELEWKKSHMHGILLARAFRIKTRMSKKQQVVILFYG
jgi:hypothetical protein